MKIELTEEERYQLRSLLMLEIFYTYSDNDIVKTLKSIYEKLTDPDNED